MVAMNFGAFGPSHDPLTQYWPWHSRNGEKQRNLVHTYFKPFRECEQLYQSGHAGNIVWRGERLRVV